MNLPRTVISNIENGRRSKITVAEVLALAAVLEIPPVALIVPVGFVESFEMLPGQFGDPLESAEWISAQAFKTEKAAEDFNKSHFGLVDELKDVRLHAEGALERLGRARQEFAELTDADRESWARYSLLQQEIKKALAEMPTDADSPGGAYSPEGAPSLVALMDKSEEMRNEGALKYFEKHHSVKWCEKEFKSAREEYLAMWRELDSLGVVIPPLADWV